MKLLVNRWVHFILLIALLGAAIFYSFSDVLWRKEMQYLVFDQLNKDHPRPASGQILIVNIDDDSLNKIGQWPWPRTMLADMVNALDDMGARVIAFDGLLAEPDRSSPDLLADNLPPGEGFEGLRASLKELENHDDILAKAIEKSGIFVSAFTFGSYSQNHGKPALKKPILLKKADQERFLKHSPRFDTAAIFLPGLEQAAAGNGSFMASPDHDGVLRHTGLVFSDGEKLYPSLALEALRVGSEYAKENYKIGETPESVRREIDTDYRILLGDYKIPVEENGKIYLHFREFDERGDDYMSAYKLLDPEYRSEALARVKNKYIFIGASAEGLKDLRSTSIEAFQPGVEIHANALEQILQNNYLTRPDEIELAEANYIMIAGLLMIFLAPFIHVITLGLLCAGFIGLAFWGGGWAYVSYGILIDPFYPSLCVFALFMLSVILTYLRVESEKAQVRSAFGLYISQDFMKELTKDPDKLKLGGEIRDLTVLFSDIRSFTTISEGLSPEELIHLMNDFLTPMSDLVMQNRGTIDKYMGDAMMAFWNAPLDVADHERHACIAALGMQDALAPINEEVAKKAHAAGREPVLLQAGIGINTGPCAVGNMGSRQRFAYSTLGDAVNLASRLEGQTKAYGVGILIGEKTQNGVPDFATLELDLLKVKGKTKPVRVFTLLGDKDYAARAGFIEWQKLHNDMIAQYRAAEFGEAEKLAAQALECAGPTWEKLYGLYKTRCAELIKSPPEKGWDGVFEATSK